MQTIQKANLHANKQQGYCSVDLTIERIYVPTIDQQSQTYGRMRVKPTLPETNSFAPTRLRHLKREVVLTISTVSLRELH